MPGVPKVLVLHNNNDLYGADKILVELLTRIDQTRFVPVVVLPTDTRHINRLSRRLEQSGIEVLFMPLGILRRKYFTATGMPKVGLDISTATYRLLRVIRQRQISLVHTNTNTILAGAFAARMAGLPHIWSVHELMVEPRSVRRTLHFLIPRLSTKVVSVSQAVRDHMLQDSPHLKNRFKFIFGGIDLRPFTGASGRGHVRREWGIADDEVLVGMAGRVTRWKGQEVFAEAARLLSEQFPKVKFAAVGGVFENETFYMERFRNQVRDLGIEDRFIISDFRSDMPSVFSAFDIFVLPSTLPEPFGLVVIEAMAASLPVVATAPGGPSETVADGETGFLVKPSDPNELAAALNVLLLDPAKRRTMGEAGRRRACQLFALDRYVKEFEDLYDELLSGPHNARGTSERSQIVPE